MCGIIFAAFLSLFLFSHSPSLFTPLSFSRTFCPFSFLHFTSPLHIFLLPPPLVFLLLHSPSHSFLFPHIFLYIFMLSTFYIFISFFTSNKATPHLHPVSTSKVIVQCCNIFWPHSIGIRNLPCLVCNWYGAYPSAFFNLSNLYTQAAPALNLLLATI